MIWYIYIYVIISISIWYYVYLFILWPFTTLLEVHQASSQLGTDAASRAAAFRTICAFPAMQRARHEKYIPRWAYEGYWFLLMGSAKFFAVAQAGYVLFRFGLPFWSAMVCQLQQRRPQSHIHSTSAAIPAAMTTVGPATWQKKLIRGRSRGHDQASYLMQDMQR